MKVHRGLEYFLGGYRHLGHKTEKKAHHVDQTQMNVILAAQTLSASVASYIDFLREEIHLSEFENSEYTTDFISRIDSAFDLLNSRNPLA